MQASDLRGSLMSRIKYLFWQLAPYFSLLAKVTVYDEKIEQERRSAREQFRNTKNSSETPAMLFDGSLATILQSSDSSTMANSGACENYSLTVIALNPHGEHFIFISNQEKPYGPYIKHLSQERAEIALKSINKKPA